MILGILAHVDAGKTTLAESMLHLSGQLRQLGRVDHQDAFLDNNALERKRGITIFSKQARFVWKDLRVTLLDTPGHVDFSAEMERTLKVLDYAVLVINGSDGVQGHTRTVWKLLEYYGVPVFLFVNKMDQSGADEGALMGQLKRQLDGNCVCFQSWDRLKQKEPEDISRDDADREVWLEELATCSEELMEEYLETGDIAEERIAEAVWERQVFPCFFGAALLEEGVTELLDGLDGYCREPEYPGEFGARVYQITRDAAGTRLTHLKVTGGKLRVKMLLEDRGRAKGEEEKSLSEKGFAEKADQLRLYNGSGYELSEEVEAGGICAVTGLGRSFVGQGFGFEEENEEPVLEPVLTYRIVLPEGMDAVRALGLLRQLEEEEPLLHILWQEEAKEIHAQVMGEVQIEILRELIKERYGMEVEFGEGSIVYKETIAAPTFGIGHFEPLRHYAEVELLLEPGERGSGLQFASVCSEDMLDRNWQRLVLTHLEEKNHVGVLTGAPITDMRILLVAGRAHLKHTEGGDFRQATYRAIRQGLSSTESVLLEPVFSFVLELPTECLGRAMSDVQRMHGSFEPAVTEGERSVLTGRAPVAAMRDYQREVNAYTHGHGHLSCMPDGYVPCHNAEEVIATRGYDPEADLTNPTGSVFCAHGAGFLVGWDQVPEYAHVEIPAGIRRLLAEMRRTWAEGGAEVMRASLPDTRSGGDVVQEGLPGALGGGAGGTGASGGGAGGTGGSGGGAGGAGASGGGAGGTGGSGGGAGGTGGSGGGTGGAGGSGGGAGGAGGSGGGTGGSGGGAGGTGASGGGAGATSVRQDRSSNQERYISQEEIEAIFSQSHANKKKDDRHRRRYHITHRDRAFEEGRHRYGGVAPGGGMQSGRAPGDGVRSKTASAAISGNAVQGSIYGEIQGKGRAGKRAIGKAPEKTCLLVDGYNIIFSWEELRELSKMNIDSARDRLMDIMSNYQGMLGGELILVFDAYKVKGNPGSVSRYHNIYVVYTKEAETADQYIEKTVHEMADKYQITVATSDGLEQMIIWGAGALRMSAAGLKEAVEQAEKALREEYTERDSRMGFRPFA